MTETATTTVLDIVDRYDADPGMLIPMMQDIQEEHGYLPRPELVELSRKLCVPLARIYSVATFYASFRLMPKGEHTIQLCMGTVCFLKGAGQIAQAIQKEFNLVPGGTSPDGKFTFSPVNCVGACALAPVMVVDGQYHGSLVVDSAVELLHKIAAAGSAEETPVERGVDGTSPKSPAVATPGLGGAKTAKKKARGGKKA